MVLGARAARGAERVAALLRPSPDPDRAGFAVLNVNEWPSPPRIDLATPSPNFVAISLETGDRRLPLAWVFNGDATRLHVELPAKAPGGLPARLVFESTEKTAQFPDGRILFSALDASVQGAKAKLETQPGNHRIGFWTDPADVVTWSYKPTRWGRYDVELVFSAEGGAGTEIEIEVAGRALRAERPSTGSWYRYQTLPLGRVYVAKAEPFVVRAACRSLKGGAVMNLKAVILRPAPEGDTIGQQASGEILLRASDAITHSTVMRYEPATNKHCLGYWVNPRDWAEWEFSVIRPGRFHVEVAQGCGKGQGGSEVAVEAGGSRLTFTVEDTGHFQNFSPRRIGQIEWKGTGAQTLAIRPIRKQAGAIMDVRQVRLIPVEERP